MNHMNTTLSALPHFQHLHVETIPTQLSMVLERHKKELESLLQENKENYTWDNLLYPLEIMSDEWHKIIGPLAHLNGVHNIKPVREAYQKCLPILTEYSLLFAHSQPLYEAIKYIRNSTDFARLTTTRQKIINDDLLNFKLAGIALNTTEKARFKAIQEALSQTCNQFENHLLDATQAWKETVTDESMIAGIPDYIINEIKNKDHWIVTLEPPIYQAIMMYADHRTLREKIYQANITRASEISPSGTQWDNSRLMMDILKLRHEEAQLLGYANYAELSLAQKMADTPQQVFDFLNNLVQKAHQQAKNDFKALTLFAQEHLKLDTLEAWDIAYVSEKRRQAEYNISQNDFRPYLPHSIVLEGLFTIANKLYGMQFKKIDDIETWHPDVMFYEVTDADKHIRGYLYLDLFARPTKRGGAWMDNCLNRQYMADKTLQYPVAYLNCNFTKPANPGEDALLSHDEVVTLFHECGHTLHHILTQINDSSAGGIQGVEWDAVELPSQFFEHWCWQKEAIPLFSRHIKTGLPIPKEMLEKLLSAKNFQSALYLMRQLEFSLFDFHIHAEYDTQKDATFIQTVLNKIRQDISVIPIVSYNRFQHSFSHIFAGGYGAGYYSYLWAELLSSDAFVAFEKEGIFNPETGQRFLKNILEVGSSRPIIDSFIAFRGQKPTIDALLRDLGIKN